MGASIFVQNRFDFLFGSVQQAFAVNSRSVAQTEQISSIKRSVVAGLNAAPATHHSATGKHYNTRIHTTALLVNTTIPGYTPQRYW